MTLLDEIHQLFINAHTGFVPLSQVNNTSKNLMLVLNIADKYGFRPVYKPRSNKILGFGDVTYSHQWATSKILDYGRYNG